VALELTAILLSSNFGKANKNLLFLSKMQYHGISYKINALYNIQNPIMNVSTLKLKYSVGVININRTLVIIFEHA
jgi:hypothetical protein